MRSWSWHAVGAAGRALPRRRAPDGDLVCSELMQPTLLFLTANVDTVYFSTLLDLTRGRWSSTLRR
jgi:hypothetical protein